MRNCYSSRIPELLIEIVRIKVNRGKDAFGHNIVKKGIEFGINLMSRLLPSEGVNSDDTSMGSSNSSEMNLDNNDKADH